MVLLAYADNSVLMNKLLDDLRTLFGQLEEAAKKVGLQVNEGITEYMVVGIRDSMIMYPSLRISNYEFNRII